MADNQVDNVANDANMSGKRVVRRFTCVNCPLGCDLTATVENGNVVNVEGNVCLRGETYAQTEATNPMRVVTGLVNVSGSEMPASCRTESAIPKALIPKCLQAMRSVELKLPVTIGQVVVPNVCGTGVDVIATRNIGR